MIRSIRLLAAFAAITTATPALAQVEIQWWHAMTGGNNDIVNAPLRRIQRSRRRTTRSFRPTRGLSRHDECRHRRVPRRQRAAHHASVRGRHRDHDGRQGCDQAGLRVDEGSERAVRSEGVSAGDHRLLLDRQGRDAVVPVQLVVDGHVGEQGCAEEGGDRRDPEDVAGGVRRRKEAEGGRPRRPAASPTPGSRGRTSSSFPPGTTCRSERRATASTASTPSSSSIRRCT